MTNHPTFSGYDVLICERCTQLMIPNISTGDDEGYAWICLTPECGHFTAFEIEAEDLIACGVPEWLAHRLEALADSLID